MKLKAEGCLEVAGNDGLFNVVPGGAGFVDLVRRQPQPMIGSDRSISNQVHLAGIADVGEAKAGKQGSVFEGFEAWPESRLHSARRAYGRERQSESGARAHGETPG